MTILWLNDNAPFYLFKDIDLQLLMFNHRCEFKNQPTDKMINFKSAYYCRNFLPQQIMWRELNTKDNGQLKLFQIEEPSIQDITIDWLLEYLNNEYPEMQFIKSSKVLSDADVVTQNLHPRIQCYFNIGKFDTKLCDKKGNYIGYAYGKEFDSYFHSAGPIDSIEEFKNKLPEIINNVKEYINEYNRIKRGKNNVK